MRSQTEVGVALRATIVLLSAQGLSAASISRALGMPPRTVHGCRHRWCAHHVLR
ncbi:helix-turn-helix domain-containing protein [Myxococcus virescens]|uniref:helix-turn-helix domain-containing protein n=1 Tax=Myxococcus virescens TaxID=83456 RepID=UPI003DA6A3EA